MAIEVPPDVDTTHPVMDIVGPGVAGKLLQATGAHGAAWIGSGGGGGGQLKLGEPVEQEGAPERGKATVVNAEFDALVFLAVRIKVAAVTGQVFFAVNGVNIYECTVANTTGPLSLTLGVPAGGTWKWDESHLAEAQIHFDLVTYQLFNK